MKLIRPARALALTAFALVAACASTAEYGPSKDSRRSPVLVTIQNNDFNDATIYAEWAGIGRTRIGQVTGKTSKTLNMEWRSDHLILQVEFVGGGGFAAESINVSAGEHLDLVIQNRG